MMAKDKEQEAAEKAALEAAEQEAAEKEAAEKAALDDGLIPLRKDGEVIRAHPDQVPLWKQQGWVVVDSNNQATGEQ